MKSFIFLGVFVISSFSWGEMRSQQALSYQQTTKTFVAELKPGFHFNEKAPNSIVSPAASLKPKQISTNQISFEYEQEPLAAKAQLYVCDDAITYCETHSISLQKSQNSSMTAEKSPLREKQKPTEKPDRNGFIHDDLPLAISLAKAQNKLIMLDFTATWCPSCRRLDQEVFSTKAFAKYRKNFIFVKLDTDRFQNSVIAEKYKILGIPTLVFLGPEQSVLAQVLDYQPLARFEKLLNYVIANPTPLENQVNEVVKLSEEEKQILGFRFYYAGDYQKANQVWSAMKVPPKDLATSQYWEAAEKFEKEALPEKDFKVLLETLLKKEADSGRSLVWRKSLLELKEISVEDKTRIFNEGVLLADSILANPGMAKTSLEGDLVGDLEGHEDFIIGNYRAELFEASKSPEAETRAAWQKAVGIGEKSHFSPQDIGPALRFLSVMGQAKEWEKGHLWILKLKKANPGYADLLRREVRFLVELKKYKNAVSVGELALKKSYERNHFWVIEYLAKAYIGNGQKQKAQNLVQSYLQKPEIEVKSLASAKKALTKLQGELRL